MLNRFANPILFLLMLLACTAVPAADRVFAQLHQRVWNTEHGLPQTSVVDITQDPAGYIWVATEGGLARYDGNQFQVFNAQNTELLRNPLLRSLHTTAAGELLIGSSDKLIRYQQQEFQELTLDGRSVGSVEAMAENSQGQVFIAAEQLLVWQQGQLSVLPVPGRPVSSLLAEGDRLWLGGPGYLALWQNGEYQLVADMPQAGWLITEMVSTASGLLLATPQGLWQYQHGQLSPAQQQIADEVLLLFQQQDNLWVATYQELRQYRGQQLLSVTDLRQHSKLGWLVSAFESREGFLWFGSKTHGLLRFRADATTNYGVASDLPDPYVWALQEAGNELLVGYNGGLAAFDGERFTSKVAPALLSHHVVYSLFREADGTIWAGTRRGLNKISADYQQVQRFSALDHIQINGIAQRRDGSIWVATFDGLYRILPHSDQPELMTPSLGLPANRFRIILTDSQDRLWLGTPNGAYVWDGLQLKKISDPRLDGVYVTFITELADGRILLGTLQHGFAFEDGQGGWQHITPEQGLPSNDVIYLAETDRGLIIANFNGVYRLSSAVLTGGELQARIIIDDIGPEAGVDGLRCCNGAGNSKGALWQGKVYLPSLNGLVSVDLAGLSDQVPVPQVLLEEIKVGQTSWPLAQPLVIDQQSRDLVFSFTAPAYYRPRTLLFRYRLNGYDQQWTTVNDRRQAFYTNLPAGEFSFEVQARYQGEGEWSAIVSQPLQIKARWYEQYWFYVLLVLLALLVIYGSYRLRLQRLARLQQQLERMVTERTQELNQANQQLAQLNQRLQLLSVTDALTGLHNRHYLQQVLDAILARARRQQRPLLCLLLDLDNFKQVNDLLGHQAGDAVLQQLAALLKRLLRQSDHLIRWGGEEFLIIQEQQDEPLAFLGRLMQAIAEEPWTVKGELPFSISCSVGVVQYPLPDNSSWTWTQALALADKALYQVKTHGKAGWLMLTPVAKATAAQSWLQQDVLQLLQSGGFSYVGSSLVSQQLQQELASAGQ
ncbi:two-component system sensor-response regulator hybrid protein [Alishewanella agri BL06]|uniref:diguanylate cyclase n=1 Tax=Alishewanella agri BL06 TaxID=1195246 RepID=I8UBF0_9ALTE|nr:ligand-binding sensor domain-containing diguanylate cyclase [Alishewanella agri]EIW90596.1 two-component system sensor-response regulator hybrid protein [Alishewanella agri BL06]